MIEALMRFAIGVTLGAGAAAMAVGAIALASDAPWWMTAPCYAFALGMGILAAASLAMAVGAGD